jgi:short-subunit dehydrogenase
MMHLAGKVIAVTGAGMLIDFTSGTFTASVAQANYSSAKGGVVSLVRSAAAGLHKYGVTANCIAPEAKSRMSGKLPMERKMGEPEDVAPLVSFLLSDHARHITGQIDSINGGQVGVYNQPAIARSMEKDQPWTVDERVERLDNELGQEQMPIFGYLDEMRKAAAAKKAGDASG